MPENLQRKPDCSLVSQSNNRNQSVQYSMAEDGAQEITRAENPPANELRTLIQQILREEIRQSTGDAQHSADGSDATRPSASRAQASGESTIELYSMCI